MNNNMLFIYGRHRYFHTTHAVPVKHFSRTTIGHKTSITIKFGAHKPKHKVFRKKFILTEKKMEEMKPYYEELANYIIDIDNKKISTVFREALAIYNYANKVKCHIFIK